MPTDSYHMPLNYNKQRFSLSPHREYNMTKARLFLDVLAPIKYIYTVWDSNSVFLWGNVDCKGHHKNDKVLGSSRKRYKQDVTDNELKHQ